LGSPGASEVRAGLTERQADVRPVPPGRQVLRWSALHTVVSPQPSFRLAAPVSVYRLDGCAESLTSTDHRGRRKLPCPGLASVQQQLGGRGHVPGAKRSSEELSPTHRRTRPCGASGGGRVAVLAPCSTRRPTGMNRRIRVVLLYMSCLVARWSLASSKVGSAGARCGVVIGCSVQPWCSGVVRRTDLAAAEVALESGSG
jgi:hypothetical protein